MFPADVRSPEATACPRKVPLRLRLTEDWGRMVTRCLETADTWGAIGHVLTHEMFNRGTLGLLEGHDPVIEKALGAGLPDAARASKRYEGRPQHPFYAKPSS